MINRSHRFHGLGSLRYVYSHGKTVRSSFMSVKYARNPQRQTYRLAVVVSKKVSNSAVIRNLIRRRLYEAMRHHEAVITEPYDIVITVFSKELSDLKYDDLQRVVKKLLQQADIVLENSYQNNF